MQFSTFLEQGWHCNVSFSLLVVPVQPPPKTGPISFPPNLKPPIPHLNARYLKLYLNRWHFLEIGILGGSVGPGAYFAPTLAGKRCISEVAPIDLCFRISGYKHYKCCITMLQGRIWGRVLGKPASGRHSHKGHRGKRQILSLHNCCEFSPRLSAQSCGQKY